LIQSLGDYDNIAILPESVDVSTTADASWLSGWDYRKSHTINGSIGASTNYQVQIIVHRNAGLDDGQDVYCGGHCRTDFGDIRFTRSDGVTELDYWLESTQAANSATFWVEVSDNLDTDQIIYIYFGNDFALSTSDGESTFIAWDDFDEGYSIGDEPKSSRGWFITDNGTGDILEIASNPSGHNGNGMRYVNVETVAPGMMLENTWAQELSISIHMKMYWDIRDGQFRFNAYDIDDEDSSVATWSNYVSGYYLRYRDSPTTNLQYSPAYELLEDEWYNIESHCESDAHSLIVNNETLSGTVRTSGDGYDHIWIYGHEDQFDDFYIDDFYVRKFVSAEPAHGSWGEEESEPANGLNWLSGWEFRKYHLIEGSIGAGCNYQVRIVVNYGVGTDSDNEIFCNGYSRTDFGDIRFTDNDGFTELDYWMETSFDSDNATFWVEVSDYLDYDQSIYTYFGNPDATNTSDGFSTFIFFDDFENNDFSRWNTTENAWSIQSSVVKHGSYAARGNAQSSNRGCRTVLDSLITTDVMFHSWVRVESTFNYKYPLIAYEGLYNPIDDAEGLAYIGYIHEDDWATFNGSAQYYELDTVSTNTWYEYEVGVDFANGLYRPFIDGTAKSAQSLDIENGVSLSQILTVAMVTCAVAGDHDQWQDDFYIRKYVHSEPTHGTWGLLDSALSISSPYSITYEGGSTGNTVLWTALSYAPDRYVIVFDGVLQVNSTWDGTDVEISCDGLSLDTHNYTLEIFNTFGHSLLKRTYVRVLDTTDPVLSQPDDVNYTVGSQGNVIEWTLNDLYPDTYELYIGNESLRIDTWNSTSETISLSVDDLPVGEYNFTIFVNDTSGNIASDLVTIRVTGSIDSVTIIVMIAGVVVIVIIGGIVCRKKKT